MSEASRIRKLFLQNILEELRSRHGPPEDWPMPDWLDHMPESAPPSWGPVGSLAKRMLPESEYERVLRHTEELNRMERSARLAREAHQDAPQQASPQQRVQPVSQEQPAQNHVLSASEAMSHLDRHGETPLFACPICGEESAKASVPIDSWHCTACDAWGRASSLVPSKPVRREVWDREPL